MPKKFSHEPTTEKNVKTRSFDTRVSFKNTYETARACKGMTIPKAIAYMEDVIAHRRCIPYRRFNGSIGRTAQAKEFGLVAGRWPQKSCKAVINLLKNLEANAVVKQLDLEKLTIQHVQVNRAQHGRRRTYRAHGRITRYMSTPCHIEIWATEKTQNVPKSKHADKGVLVKKRTPRRFLKSGEN